MFLKVAIYDLKISNVTMFYTQVVNLNTKKVTPMNSVKHFLFFASVTTK